MLYSEDSTEENTAHRLANFAELLGTPKYNYLLISTHQSEYTNDLETINQHIDTSQNIFNICQNELMLFMKNLAKNLEKLITKLIELGMLTIVLIKNLMCLEHHM